MIKIIKNLSLILLTSFSLILPSGCGESKTYNYDDYIIKLNVSKNEPFKIMQLSDLHLGINGDIQKQYQFSRENIFESKPNLIVLTGDSFMYATRELVYDFIDFLNETIDDLEKELNRRVYYTYTYGNHDLQGNYDYYFINNALLEDSKKASSSCLFIDYKDDDLTGNTNFCIDLYDENNENDLLYRFYIIDSNTYHANVADYDYDVIHQDQLDHIKNIHENTDDKDYCGLAFFHIPLFEFQTANDIKDENSTSYPRVVDYIGENNEKSGVGYTDEFKPYDVLYDCNVRGIFVGHDHLNYSSIEFIKSSERNESVILSYGVKSTNQIYHDDNILGYKEANLDLNNPHLSLDNINIVKDKKYE